MRWRRLFLSLGASLSFAATTVQAQGTPVTGTITTQTWTKANSPYRVTGAITVSSGNTLTIEPGVDVLFDADVQFIVNGVLHAVGTPQDSIRFLTGTAPEWGGIRISGGDSSTLACVRITGGHADNGGGGLFVSGPMTRVIVQNSVIHGNRADLYGGGIAVWGYASLKLMDCVVRDNAAGAVGGGIDAWNGASVVVRGGTISGNSAGIGGGVAASMKATVLLSTCAISDNSATHGGAAFAKHNGAVAMFNCVITGNSATANGGAIYAAVLGQCGLANCTVARNIAGALGGAIFVQGLDSGNLGEGGFSASLVVFPVNIANCILWGNAPHEVFTLGTTVVMNYSDVRGGLRGYDGSGSVSGAYNVDQDPLFVDAANGDYRLRPESPCRDAGSPRSPNDPDGTRRDMGSVPDAVGTPVAGEFGTTVWTKENGPYYVLGSVTMPKGDTLTIAPGTEVVFESGDRFYIYGVLLAVGTEQDSIRVSPGALGSVSRLQFRGTSAAFSYVSFRNYGLDLSTGASISISHCTFIGSPNYAYAATTISDCTFRDVIGPAFVLRTGSSMTRCTITNCRNESPVEAGALSVQAGAVTVTDCIISGNRAVRGGGVYVSAYAVATLTRCVITDNTAYKHPSLPNPPYGYGGGVFVERSGQATLINCTVSGNTAVEGGGVAAWRNSSADQTRLTLQNTIIWGNSPQSLFTRADLPAQITATYSDVEGGYAGAGNIDADPRFADPTNRDYRLLADSPCRDTGDPASQHDPDGSRADMGALPYSPTPKEAGPVPSDVAAARALSFALDQNYPNPFNPETVIRFTTPASGVVNLTIYDLNGRFALTLVDGTLGAGTHEVVWDGRDSAGRNLASGMYLYRLASAEGVLVRRMLLVR